MLHHFDSNGTPTQEAKELEDSSFENEALSTEEFEQLQRDIHKMRSAILRHKGVSEAEVALDVSVEGFLPGVQDHRIDRYIANIRRQIRDEVTSFRSPVEKQTRRAAMESGVGPIPTGAPAQQEVGVLLRLQSTDWVPPAHLKIGSRFETFVTAVASEADLQALQADPGVVSIEISGDGGVKDLDTSVPFVGGDTVHRPPIPERGDQALVGVIDTGIDVLHEAFLDSDGNSRILGVWNQRDSTGPSPQAVDPTFTQDYGTLYVPADIAGFLANPALTPGSLRDPATHGTHVASIAAGRAAGPTLADGLAPEAGLIVVIPNSKTEPGSPPSLGYSMTHVDALQFLKLAALGNNAVSVNALPIAVNVSLGMNAGAHDGTTLVEAAFDSVTAGGRDPGYVIVKSAGNERGRGGHSRVRAIEGGILPIEWNSSGFRFQDYIEVWYHARDELRFCLVDPAGNRLTIVDEANPQAAAVLGGNHCRLDLTTRHIDNGENLLTITISPQLVPIQAGRWSLQIEGVTLRSGDGFVDAWVERDDARAVTFIPDDPYMTLSIPGTAQTVISVGASSAALPFELTASSSFGLTRDQRPKPDLIAPGADIVAAAANTNDHRETVAYTGTSMAAPHVTGALALVLSGRHKSGNPQYNARQLQRGLINSAQASGGFHNEGSGWGLLDAASLFQEMVP